MCTCHAAEAKVAHFSWRWRFAVIFSIAKVIFDKRGDPTRSIVARWLRGVSLNSCETSLGKIISISLWRPELGPQGCRMNSG